MKIGTDVIINDDVTFKRPELVSIGNHVAIDKGFYCTTGLEVGNYVHISPYVTCIGGADGKFICKGFNCCFMKSFFSFKPLKIRIVNSE